MLDSVVRAWRWVTETRARKRGLAIGLFLVWSAILVGGSVANNGRDGWAVAILPGLVAVLWVLLAIQGRGRRKAREASLRVSRGYFTGVILGSSGVGLHSGEQVVADFYYDGAIAVSTSRGEVCISHEHVVALHVDGPGIVSTGGGYVGGGFGLAGAAEGILAASFLNSASRTTYVVTKIHVTALSGAFTLQTSDAGLLQTQQVLADLDAYIRHKAAMSV